MAHITLRNILGVFDVRIDDVGIEQIHPDDVLENFKKEDTITEQMKEYNSLLDQEQAILKKRVESLANLKAEFDNYSKEKYPEYFL